MALLNSQQQQDLNEALNRLNDDEKTYIASAAVNSLPGQKKADVAANTGLILPTAVTNDRLWTLIVWSLIALLFLALIFYVINSELRNDELIRSFITLILGALLGLIRPR